MTALALGGIAKRFGQVQAVESLDLRVEKGEFVCLLGPTNAGKSTLLKIVAGLCKPDQGRVLINGRDVTTVDPAQRNVSLLFQNVALFPHLTGFDNIAFPLRRARMCEDAVRARVREVAELLRIAPILERLPATYSGGERQRVAIGRAIARPADVILLDEPLSNLDARIRLDLRIEFRRLHRKLGQTVLYVTHDHVEALSLADRVAVLRSGVLQQVDPPEHLLERPANGFVAEFIGSPPMNLIPVRVAVENGRTRLVGAGFAIDAPAGVPVSLAGRDLRIGVRPEAVRASSSPSADTPFAAPIRWIEQHGSRAILDAEFGGIIVKASVPPDSELSVDGRAWLGITPRCRDLLDLANDCFLS
ncbi:MAG: ABC transporter ATP-binding protein [Xanthobacteraceae bacterium]|jgi:ABC-type sugar transport system ATPase subunit